MTALARTPLLIALALLAACQSQDPRHKDPALRTWEQNRMSQLFRMVDADQDGRVTPEEFQLHYVPVTWLYFDKNGDGVITPGEWAQDGNSRQRFEWFHQLDANQDGVVTRKEFDRAMTPEGTQRYFALMDRDGNGVITVDDILAR